ncbi:MAG: arsenate reductase family protein [Clostridia bacterium]|nr:arsenate reductase family protein [Clostridia bacterium]
MKFICYPKCTTCQKAKKWLDETGAEYELRNIKEENPTFDELKAWYAKSGLPLKKFFNTSGLLYKSMELKDKLPSMSDEEQLELLATDGMLVKRPLLIGEDFVLTGFREKDWAQMLMYGKEASNRKQEIDRQHYTIPNQRPKDKHCGKI